MHITIRFSRKRSTILQYHFLNHVRIVTLDVSPIDAPPDSLHPYHYNATNSKSPSPFNSWPIRIKLYDTSCCCCKQAMHKRVYVGVPGRERRTKL